MLANTPSRQIHILKCSKTHLQQTRISKIFRGTNPRTPATGSALEHNEQGRLTPALRDSVRAAAVPAYPLTRGQRNWQKPVWDS